MTTPRFDCLQLSVDAGVAVLRLDRADKANALHLPLWSALGTALRWCDGEPAVRAVVLAGNGRHFCAGIDLSLFAALDDATLEPGRRGERRRATILGLQRDFTALEDCRKPVLAAIHGSCLGAGLDLACCADMRYCTGDAVFQVRETGLGIVADVGTLQRLPRLVASGLARELAYTGRRMPADEALRAGFVNAVFAGQDELLAAVVAIAATIARRSPLAVRGTKDVLLHARDHSVADGLRYVATWNAGMLSAADLMGTVQAGGDPDACQYPD